MGFVVLVAKSCPTLVTPWTVACQAPLSMRFPRQEYWSGLPFSPPGDLLNPGIEPGPRVSPMLAGRFFTTESPGTHLSKRKYGISISGSLRLGQTGSCYLDLGVLTCMNSNCPATVQT